MEQHSNCTCCPRIRRRICPHTQKHSPVCSRLFLPRKPIEVDDEGGVEEVRWRRWICLEPVSNRPNTAIRQPVNCAKINRARNRPSIRCSEMHGSPSHAIIVIHLTPILVIAPNDVDIICRSCPHRLHVCLVASRISNRVDVPNIIAFARQHTISRRRSAVVAAG